MTTLAEQLAALEPDQTWASLTTSKKDDLGLLAARPGLTGLSLHGRCPALAPLSALSALESLNLQIDKRVDLAPLLALPRLRDLNLGGPITADQAAQLARMPALQQLSFTDGAEHLAGHPMGVTRLHVASSKFEDLRCVAHLPLEHLHVGARRSAVQDLSPLAGLRSLTRLDLDGSQVSDLRPLSGLEQLEALWLQSVKTLESVAGLEGCVGLVDLNLNLTKVEDLSPLSGLLGLTGLQLRGTRVQTLEALLGLTQLESLYLEKSRLRDLVGVQQLGALKRLWIFDSKVKQLAPLAGHPSLEELNIAGLRRLEDPEVISTLRALRKLDAYQVELDPMLLVPLAKLEEVRGCDFPPPGWAGQAAATPMGAEALGPGMIFEGSVHVFQLPGEAQDMAVDGDRVYLSVVGDPTASTIVLDARTGERLGGWNPGRIGAGVSVSNGRLYVLDRDELGHLKLWRELDGGLALWKEPEGRGYGARLEASPDGRFLAILADGLRALDLEAGGEEVLHRPRAQGLFQACRGCFSDRGSIFVAGLVPEKIQELAVPGGALLRELELRTGEPASLHLGGAGRFLVAKGWSMGGSTLIDLETGEGALEDGSNFGEGSRGLSAGAISADGSLLVVPRYQLLSWRLPPTSSSTCFMGPKLPIRGMSGLVARTEDALLFALYSHREGTRALARVPLTRAGG